MARAEDEVLGSFVESGKEKGGEMSSIYKC